LSERRDEYLLNQSAPFTVTDALETRTDLTLTLNPAVSYNAISGTITDTTGAPIRNVLVKFLSTDGSPVTHTYTDSTGAYGSVFLPAGTYVVEASKTGYLLGGPVTVPILGVPGGPRINFTLAPDPQATLNNIFGLVRNTTTSARLGGATVTASSGGTVVAVTTTDSDGEYLLCATANGTYTLVADLAGYNDSPPVTVTVTGSQIARADLYLTAVTPSPATVHGFIRDAGGGAIEGACVCLYLLSGTTETLVQTTLTNTSGLYLFGEVAPGQYLVKAKDEVTL
jgi:protocatechuate 3,4-dioxygenase beta subunit